VPRRDADAAHFGEFREMALIWRDPIASANRPDPQP
jgi:hypothetical protein